MCDNLRMEGWIVDGAKLRALREDAGLTLANMAERVPCHISYVWRVEARGQQPRGRICRGFARVLSEASDRDVTIAEFATPTDDAVTALRTPQATRRAS